MLQVLGYAVFATKLSEYNKYSIRNITQFVYCPTVLYFITTNFLNCCAIAGMLYIHTV